MQKKKKLFKKVECREEPSYKKKCSKGKNKKETRGDVTTLQSPKKSARKKVGQRKDA